MYCLTTWLIHDYCCFYYQAFKSECKACEKKKPPVAPKPVIPKKVSVPASRPVPRPRRTVSPADKPLQSSAEVLPKRDTPEFCLHMYQNEIVPPSNWSVYTPDKNVKQWKIGEKGKPHYTLKTVNQSTFKAIERLVLNTWEPAKVGQGRDAAGLADLGFTKLKVTKIERIENLNLYEQYCQSRQQLFHKAGEGNCYNNILMMKQI
jgi:hypothetical protein